MHRCKFQVTITLFSFVFFLLLFCVHLHVHDNLSLHVVFLQNEDMKYQNDNLAITITKCELMFSNYCKDIEKKFNNIFLCFFHVVTVNDYLYNRVGHH